MNSVALVAEARMAGGFCAPQRERRDKRSKIGENRWICHGKVIVENNTGIYSDIAKDQASTLFRLIEIRSWPDLLQY